MWLWLIEEPLNVALLEFTVHWVVIVDSGDMAYENVLLELKGRNVTIW